LRSDKRYYCSNEYQPFLSQHYIADGDPDGAEDRLCFKGILMVTGNMGADADFKANTIFGDVYLRYTIELSDIGSNPSAPITGLSLTRSEKRVSKLLDQMRALEIKQSKHDDLKSILKHPMPSGRNKDFIASQSSFPAVDIVEHKVSKLSLHNMLSVVDAQEAAPGPVNEFVPSDQDSEDGLVTVQRE